MADEKQTPAQREEDRTEDLVPRPSPDLTPEDDIEEGRMPGDASGNTPAALPDGRLRVPVMGAVLESDARARGLTVEELNEEMHLQQEELAPADHLIAPQEEEEEDAATHARRSRAAKRAVKTSRAGLRGMDVGPKTGKDDDR